MAIISVGYDGIINEVQWAEMVKKVGSSDYGVVSEGDLKVTAVAGTDRTVSISAGKCWGHGVFDENTASLTVQLDSVPSGSRWDLIAVRRNWNGTGGATTIVKVNGTSSRDIPSVRAKGPGTIDEQPIALVRVQSGSTAIQEIVDLRCWGSNGGLYGKDELVKNYLNKVGAEVRIGLIVWRYTLGANDIPQWEAELTPGVYTAIQPTGYSIEGGFWVEQVGTRRRVVMDITVTRTGGNGTIPTSFASFGFIVPTAARGSAPHKYIPVHVSGGNLGNNIVAGLFVNPFNGEMMIRGVNSAFTFSTGARFTVNLTYYI